MVRSQEVGTCNATTRMLGYINDNGHNQTAQSFVACYARCEYSEIRDWVVPALEVSGLWIMGQPNFAFVTLHRIYHRTSNTRLAGTNLLIINSGKKFNILIILANRTEAN